MTPQPETDKPTSEFVQSSWYCDKCATYHFGNCPKMKVTMTATSSAVPKSTQTPQTLDKQLNSNIKVNEDGTISPIDPSKPFSYSPPIIDPDNRLDKLKKAIWNTESAMVAKTGSPSPLVWARHPLKPKPLKENV